MIRSKQDLEEMVLKYNPHIQEKIEADPSARRTLEDIAGEEYDKYSPHFSSVSSKVGGVGRTFGYVGDLIFFGSAAAALVNPIFAPYMLTGLLAKKINLATQIPETVRTVGYAYKTGDVEGALQNVVAKVASYLPGATFVDRGLGRIAERRAVSNAVYRLQDELGFEKVPWYKKIYRSLKASGNYKDVKDRSENIIRPNFRQEVKRKAA